jgi:hypothetical protein
MARFCRRRHMARGGLELSPGQFRVLLGVGSALVIVASTAFFIHRLRRSDQLDVEPTRLVLICTQCGQEWAPSKEDLQPLGSGPQAVFALQRGLDCRHCGGVKTMRMTIQCPKCGKHYLSQTVLDPKADAAGRARDVCPDCNADYLEAKRESH